MKKYKILIKFPSRNRSVKFISSISNIMSKISDKENYIILVSADRDDPMMLNKEVLNMLKPHIDSGKLVVCYDRSNSKIDAINRDMELITDWDICISMSDDVEFSSEGFDNSIRAHFINNFPDTDGQMFYDTGKKSIVVIGKSRYDKIGYLYNPSKKNNLFVNYYTDKNEERTKELNFCILENLKNEAIDNVVVIANEKDSLILKTICTDDSSKKIIIQVTDSRPSFNDYLKLTTKLFSGEDNVNIIANSDMVIPAETLAKANSYLKNKTCLALTRWDMQTVSDYKNNSVFLDRRDSQDCWFFMGGVPQITGADYSLGIAGVDNSVAHLLEQGGYSVINPSKTLKTYHYHLTNVRNYTNLVGHDIFRIEPPYKLLEPTE